MYEDIAYSIWRWCYPSVLGSLYGYSYNVCLFTILLLLVNTWFLVGVLSDNSGFFSAIRFLVQLKQQYQSPEPPTETKKHE